MADGILFTIAVALTFLLAGAVKGVVGFGLPTISVALMSLILPPVEAAAVLVIPALVTNVWQMIAGPALFAMLRRFATMSACIIAGTFISIGLLTGPSTAMATGALGAVLALYAAYGLLAARIEVKPAAEVWLSPLVGMITGLLCGGTGVFVIPVVPYLAALKMERDELVQSVGISAFVSPLALGLALLVQGSYQSNLALPSLIAVLPAMAGMAFGQRVRDRLHPVIFRRWFFVGMFILGAYMFLRGLSKVLG